MTTQVEAMTVTVSTQPATETWAAIPGYQYLEASSEGRIRSFRRPDNVTGLPYRILALPPSSTGYLILSQKDDTGRVITKHVHKLVALAHLGPKPEGMIVLHKNDRRDDNRVTNLYYGTYAQNFADSVANGGRYVGPNLANWGKNSNLTANDVRIIRRKFAAGSTVKEITAELGLNDRAVRRIVRGESFAWVGADSAETARIRAAAEAKMQLAIATIRVARSSHTPPASAPTSKGGR